MAKKPQTEEKAKGLYDKVGNYSGKTLNLSRKQLGAAGRAAASVRGGKNVDISKTKYDATSKKVMGPAGKPLTGRVDLGGGNIGVYKNGVRVRAASGKSGTGGTGGTGGGGTGSTAKSNAPTGKAANALARSNKATVAAQSGYTAGSKGNGYSNKADVSYMYPKYAPGAQKDLSKRIGRNASQAYAVKPLSKEDKQRSDATQEAVMTGLSLIPGVGAAGAAMRGARAAVAARGAAQAGLRGVAGKAADRRLAQAIAEYKPKPKVSTPSTPTAAASKPSVSRPITRPSSRPTGKPAAATKPPVKPVPKPANAANQRATAKATANATARRQAATRQAAANNRASREAAATAARRQASAAKAAATRKANREAAAAAAAKGKGGKKR